MIFISVTMGKYTGEFRRELPASRGNSGRDYPQNNKGNNMQDTIGTATYSPEDNKLRLYPFQRLEPGLYARVKEAGFKWAPKQELFVAPMWTPSRADLLTDLCGDIGDEDKSLVERATERAERFDDYSAKRAEDAESAHAGVESIAGNIPLGQPILVGHHSERRARKDAERIENGMRKAVKMWETSKYWQDRAAGALRHASHKEAPEVRARRIKGLEADRRKQDRILKDLERGLRFWNGQLALVNRETGQKRPLIVSNDTHSDVVKYLGCESGSAGGYYKFPLSKYPRQAPASQYEGSMSLWSALGGSDGPEFAIVTVEQAKAIAIPCLESSCTYHQRWLDHYTNRIEYERAMLGESGGLQADKFNIVVGGQVKRRGQWFVVVKVNRRDEAIFSLTVSGHWKTTVAIEEVQDYMPPVEGDTEKVLAVKAAPLCNYPGEGFATMTQAEWDKAPKDYKTIGRRANIASSEKYAVHRVRSILGVYATLPPESEEEKRKPYYVASNYSHRYWHVFITDAKIKMPPKPESKPGPAFPERHAPDVWGGHYQAPEPTKFDALKDSLKAGVKVVSAPQLFPTPPELAKRMVEAAFENGWGIQICAEMNERCRILEPSAGTGNIVRAIQEANQSLMADSCEVHAVEINSTLAHGLEKLLGDDVVCADFLQCNGNLGKFDRILMNPPFENGSDIKHIKHAAGFLNPGGRLVAICGNGPRQRAELMPLADTWEDLPEGSFKSQGTNVNTAMLVIQK
jgi:protein-L-isoaspartate O-methyltransferase